MCYITTGSGWSTNGIETCQNNGTICESLVSLNVLDLHTCIIVYTVDHL